MCNRLLPAEEFFWLTNPYVQLDRPDYDEVFRAEFLREVVPKANIVGVLFNPLNPTNPVIVKNLRARRLPSD